MDYVKVATATKWGSCRSTTGGDNECTNGMLSLVGYGIPAEEITTSTNSETQDAEEWAGSVYLQASDTDDVGVPPVLVQQISYHEQSRNVPFPFEDNGRRADENYKKGTGL